MRQDYIGCRESRLPPTDVIPDEWPQVSTREAVLTMFFVGRMSYRQIAKKLNISKSYTHKIVKQHRPILVQHIRKSVQNGGHAP